MNEKALDPDKDELLIMLMTRVGMIMEDSSMIALNARSAGLHDRVRVVAAASTKIVALALAARVLAED